MVYRTDNPLADFEANEWEKEKAAELLPECDYCGEKIYDDFCYEINDEYICESCLKENFRKLTMDLMG